MKTYRDYEFESDKSGMPTKMIWRGDAEIKKTKAERNEDRLAEWEAIYGKRQA